MVELGKKLRVGIAGHGVVGKIRHQFIDQHPRMLVTAVCDQNFAKSGSRKLKDVHCLKSYKELLQEPLDVLFVCVPNYLASDVTIAGLEKGLHVFCEKPPGRDVADVLRVMACEKKYPRQKLMYGFNHRYHDSVREAQRIIRSGKLGAILYLRGVYGKSKIISFSFIFFSNNTIVKNGCI